MPVRYGTPREELDHCRAWRARLLDELADVTEIIAGLEGNVYQSLTIVGNLGADAEMRYTPSGAAVSNFRVAVNERWNDREGQAQEKTTWFRVALWGKQAEAISQYLLKGKEVLVEGSVEASAYIAQDGTAKAGLELRARNVRLLGGKGDNTDTDNGPSPLYQQIARQDRQAPPEPVTRTVKLHDLVTDEPIPF